jgi:hypothetical protein
MRQTVADAISKFQKITRQMLCDKCYATNVMRQMFQKWRHTYPSNVKWWEHYANPQNADVTSAAIWGVTSTTGSRIRRVKPLSFGNQMVDKTWLHRARKAMTSPIPILLTYKHWRSRSARCNTARMMRSFTRSRRIDWCSSEVLERCRTT